MRSNIVKILSARTYEEIIEYDLELIWRIKRFCKARPWLEVMLNRVVSKHPMYDICLVLWIIFVVGWIEAGHSHFWVCAVNVVFVLLTRRIIEAKRPVEYDRRLRPRTDINAESYGLPSLETHMSVVILGHLYSSFLLHHPQLSKNQKRFAFFSTSALSTSFSGFISSLKSEDSTLSAVLWQWLFSNQMIASCLLLITVAVSLFIGFSRIYSASRFPHQIVASYITGFVGLLVSQQCCEHMAFHKMRDFEHYSCMVFVVLGMFANIAMSMENNDSRLLHIPKKEFMRVICDILDSSKSGNAVLASNEERDGYEPEGMPRAAALSPRSLALRAAQDQRRRQQTLTGQGLGIRARRYVKSDSLYYLQKSMELREKGTAVSGTTTSFSGPEDSRRRNQQPYGTEDFYSSDTDMQSVSEPA